MSEVLVTHSGPDPNIKQRIADIRATSQGPEGFALTAPSIEDALGNPARVFTKNQEFQICVTLLYLEKFADLHPKVFVNLTCMDLSSCEEYKAHCISCQFNLECDRTETRVCFKLKCEEDGIFTCAVSAALGESDCFDFHCFTECYACHPSCIFDEGKTSVQSQQSALTP